jgi:hypothetical protein
MDISLREEEIGVAMPNRFPESVWDDLFEVNEDWNEGNLSWINV